MISVPTEAAHDRSIPSTVFHCLTSPRPLVLKWKERTLYSFSYPCGGIPSAVLSSNIKGILLLYKKYRTCPDESSLKNYSINNYTNISDYDFVAYIPIF